MVIIATNNDMKFRGLRDKLEYYGRSVMITNNIKEIADKVSKAYTLLVDESISFMGYSDFMKSLYPMKLNLPTYIILDGEKLLSDEEIMIIFNMGEDIQFVESGRLTDNKLYLYIINKMDVYKKIIKLEKSYINMRNRVQDKTTELIDAQTTIITALADLAESRDNVTGAHLQRVSEICYILASNLDGTIYEDEIDSSKIFQITTSCLLHDIGKVGISDKVLNKPGKLTEAEYEHIKEHVLIGINILSKIIDYYPNNNYIETGLEILAYHHERWDGTGYPHGLKQYDIPLSARIMAIADVYDAMRSERPYKKPSTHEECVEEIVKCSGKHFDPELVRAFIKVEKEIDSVYT